MTVVACTNESVLLGLTRFIFQAKDIHTGAEWNILYKVQVRLGTIPPRPVPLSLARIVP